MIHDPKYLAQQAYHWATGSTTAINRYASAIDLIQTPDDYLDPAHDAALNNLFYQCVAGIGTGENARYLIRQRVEEILKK